jgi:hypothetical protein
MSTSHTLFLEAREVHWVFNFEHKGHTCFLAVHEHSRFYKPRDFIPELEVNCQSAGEYGWKIKYCISRVRDEALNSALYRFDWDSMRELEGGDLPKDAQVLLIELVERLLTTKPERKPPETPPSSME